MTRRDLTVLLGLAGLVMCAVPAVLLLAAAVVWRAFVDKLRKGTA
jgi:uncharacterized protein YqgC (DUF456 family)